MRVLKPGDINPSAIRFSDPKTNPTGSQSVYVNYPPGAANRFDEKIVLHTPAVSIPFGISDYNGKLSLDLSIKDSGFIDCIKNIDECIKKTAVANSIQWFGKSLSEDQIEQLYKPSLRQNNPKFPLLMKAKMFTRDDTFEGDIFDHNKNPTDMSAIRRGSSIQAIVQLVGVYLVAKEFGCSWKVTQVKVLQNRNIEGYAFVDDDDDGPVEP